MWVHMMYEHVYELNIVLNWIEALDTKGSQGILKPKMYLLYYKITLKKKEKKKKNFSF